MVRDSNLTARLRRSIIEAKVAGKPLDLKREEIRSIWHFILTRGRLAVYPRFSRERVS